MDPSTPECPEEASQWPVPHYQLTKQEVDQIWSVPTHTLAKQKESLDTLRRWLGRKCKKPNPLGLYLIGQAVDDISPDHMADLAADMLFKIRPKSKAVSDLLLLGKVIDYGNELDIFELCPPPVPLITPRQRSPFSEMRWPHLDVASRLRDRLSDSLRYPTLLPRNKMPPKRIAQYALGQILISAIVHGGLIHKDILEALVFRLRNDSTVLDCLGDRVFVELSLGWRQQVDAEFRRWFPDDLTAAMLLYLKPELLRTVFQDVEETHLLNRAIWPCIRTFLRHARIKGEHFPRSLSVLLDAVKLDFETRMPIMLAHYASRNFVAHSLKPEVWRRLHGLTVSASTPAMPESSRAISPPGMGLTTDVDDTEEVEPRWLRPLREALRPKIRYQSENNIKALLDQPAIGFKPGQPGHLFARFAYRLLKYCNDNKVKMSVRAAGAYVISVSKRLGGLIGADDLSHWGASEWTALYEEALSDVEHNKGQRRKLARALREFQRYLELDHGAEKIDEGEVFGSADGLVPVDANIISHDEFLRIRDRFAKEVLVDFHSDLADIAWLMLTLAYRCGLRRMEALKLELNDVLIEAPAELLVRPTEARRLKTKSSTRKIPLHALLDAVEMTRLKEWLERRREFEQQNNYSIFLFAVPALKFVFTPQDTLFKLLHRVMREVTGDSSLRYHHLRHTFATCSQIALALTAAAKPSLMVKSLPGFGLTAEAANEFRQRLYGNARMTRRDIWAVSELLGHSSPEVSLQHYIHLLDLTLADQLRHPDIAPDVATVVAATNKSDSRAYAHQNESTLSAWIATLWRQHHPSQTKDQTKSQTKHVPAVRDNPATTENADKTDTIDRIWRLLFAHSVRHLSIAELVQTYGVDARNMDRYIRNAQWLHAMTLSASGKKYRHRFHQKVPDKRFPDHSVRTLAPIKPHEHRDRRLIQELLPKMRSVAMQEKDLTARVFEYFAHNAKPNFAGLIFKEPAQPQAAIDYLTWLGKIGIDGRNLRFISYDVSSVRSRWPNAWRHALGLPRAQVIEKLPPPNGRKDWPCSWFGIEPVFPDESSAFTGAAALRYCLVMAIISMYQ